MIPPYIRGLMNIFSSGRRTAAAFAVIGITIITTSLLTSFVSHSENEFYSGQLVTANTWTYAGIFFLILAILALIGDFAASAARQEKVEIERRARVRSAAEGLENAVGVVVGSTADEGTGSQQAESVADALHLSVLWKLTNARLEDYHGIATHQARSSFRTAQVAICAGFILLLGFAFLSFHSHSTAASITIAALGGVTAGLAGYIGRTFIRSQETAARYLRAYFDQPLAFSRYLAAERLLSSQSGVKEQERDALLRIIISAMVENFGASVESNSGEREDLIEGLRALLKISD